MSNTAHQREIKDLRKAGLNPILSAKYGGSSTPSGASSAGAKADIRDIGTPAAQTFMASQQSRAQVANVKQQTANLEVDNRLKEIQVEQAIDNREVTGLEIILRRFDVIYAQPERLKLLIEDLRIKQQTTKNLKKDELIKETTIFNLKLDSQIKATQNETDKQKLIHLRTLLVELRAKEAFWTLGGARLLWAREIASGIGNLGRSLRRGKTPGKKRTESQSRTVKSDSGTVTNRYTQEY